MMKILILLAAAAAVIVTQDNITFADESDGLDKSVVYVQQAWNNPNYVIYFDWDPINGRFREGLMERSKAEEIAYWATIANGANRGYVRIYNYPAYEPPSTHIHPPAWDEETAHMSAMAFPMGIESRIYFKATDPDNTENASSPVKYKAEGDIFLHGAQFNTETGCLSWFPRYESDKGIFTVKVTALCTGYKGLNRAPVSWTKEVKITSAVVQTSVIATSNLPYGNVSISGNKILYDYFAKDSQGRQDWTPRLIRLDASMQSAPLNIDTKSYRHRPSVFGPTGGLMTSNRGFEYGKYSYNANRDLFMEQYKLKNDKVVWAYEDSASGVVKVMVYDIARNTAQCMFETRPANIPGYKYFMGSAPVLADSYVIWPGKYYAGDKFDLAYVPLNGYSIMNSIRWFGNDLATYDYLCPDADKDRLVFEVNDRASSSYSRLYNASMQRIWQNPALVYGDSMPVMRGDVVVSKRACKDPDVERPAQDMVVVDSSSPARKVLIKATFPGKTHSIYDKYVVYTGKESIENGVRRFPLHVYDIASDTDLVLAQDGAKQHIERGQKQMRYWWEGRKQRSSMISYPCSIFNYQAGIDKNRVVWMSDGKVYMSTFTLPPIVKAANPSCLQAGSVITITGINFGYTQDGGHVLFKDKTGSEVTEVRIESWANTEIKCIVPAGMASDYTVRVVNKAGVSYNSLTLPRVNANPSVTGYKFLRTVSYGNGCGRTDECDPAPVSAGRTVNMRVKLKDPDGGNQIKECWVVIGTTPDVFGKGGAMVVRYLKGDNGGQPIFSMTNDLANGWQQSYIGGKQSNAYGTLDRNGCSINVSGENAVLEFSVSFAGSFTGIKNVYAYCYDEKIGTSGGWLKVASFEIRK